MVMARLIARKRDGHPLSPSEWDYIVTHYTAGAVPDYQMSALLMAVYFRGLQLEELIAFTTAMMASGASLRRGSGVPRVDKHSTGGVGDKTSLVIAPLVAAAGLAVPMMSGRGLGHTGGTLDKLESIPGFRTSLSLREAEAQLERIGVAMFGQSEEIAPADRLLYALRDVTGTVESIPLISASIMSKKLVEGLDGLVLDVKTGDGAFLTDADQAACLAETMILLGRSNGCRVTALLTDMSRPLGHAVGNALEVEEAAECLKGRGPRDVVELSLELAAEMLLSGGVAPSIDSARSNARETLRSGAALEKFRQIIEAQGGNPAILDDTGALPAAPVQSVVRAAGDGYITRIATRELGHVVVALGGGRRVKEDQIDPGVGLLVTARPGDAVARGEPLATVFASSEAAAVAAARSVAEAFTFSSAPPVVPPLISRRLTADATPGAS